MAIAMDAQSIHQSVQDSYGLAARTSAGDYGSTVAKAFGYSEEELASTPQDANLGLSCGNPFVIANLREGETVIDLGSGAGFDVFLAAKKVGARGKVYGVDQNKDMLAKANRNKHSSGAENVVFTESPITNIQLADAAADCIISNCVINLVPTPEKQLVFNEMYRLLKPGGRVAVSDILLKKELPEELKNDMALYVGCIAGAGSVEDYEMYLRDAGFEDTLIVDDKSDLNVYKTATSGSKEGRGCCGAVPTTKSSCGQKAKTGCGSKAKEPSESETIKHPLDSGADELDFNEWAASFKVYAVRR